MTRSDLSEALDAIDREALASLDKLRNLRREVQLLRSSSADESEPSSLDLGIPINALQERAILLQKKAGSLALSTSGLYKTISAFAYEIPGVRAIIAERDYVSIFNGLRHAIRGLFKLLWLSRKIIVD